MRNELQGGAGGGSSTHAAGARRETVHRVLRSRGYRFIHAAGWRPENCFIFRGKPLRPGQTGGRYADVTSFDSTRSGPWLRLKLARMSLDHRISVLNGSVTRRDRSLEIINGTRFANRSSSSFPSSSSERGGGSINRDRCRALMTQSRRIPPQSRLDDRSASYEKGNVCQLS